MSFGPAVGKLAAVMGAPLFPGQQFVFDVALEVDRDGQLVYDEVLDFEPRRSGKSHKTKSLVAWRCGRETSTAWMTAQSGKSAVKRWRDVADDVTKAFGPRVRRRIGQAYEEVRWANGSVFQPFAPTEEGMHGEDPDLVILDEWWTVDLAMKALLEVSYEPAFSVNPDAQAWKLSAAGTPKSAALREDRTRGRARVEAGSTTGLACFEWSIPERVNGRPVAELADSDLVALVMANHPRAGRGLRESFLWSQLEPGKSRAAFIRSYGNIDQAEDRGEIVIGQQAWERSLSAEEVPVNVRVGVGVEVDPEGRESSVVTGWRSEDGRALVQVTRTAPGVRWLAEYVAAMPGVALVSGWNLGRTRAALEDIENAGVEVLKLSTPTMAAASSALWDGLVEEPPAVWHDGSEPLESALRASGLAPGKPWVSRTGEPVATVQAASAALWAADRLPEEAKPLPRFEIW